MILLTLLNLILLFKISFGIESEGYSYEDICPRDKIEGEEPCSVDDYKCIGKILSANSYCSPFVQGYMPEEFTIRMGYDMPFHHVTGFDSFYKVIGMNNCKVSKFIVYAAPERIVLSVECPNLQFLSNQTNFYYSATKLPSTFEPYNVMVDQGYPNWVFTVDFRHAKEIDLCSSIVFASDGGKKPSLKFTGGDKKTQKALDKDLFKFYAYTPPGNAYVRAFTAGQLFREFVQRMLCDFYCFWYGRDNHHPGKQNMQYLYAVN